MKASPAKKAKKGSATQSLAESSSQTKGLSMFPAMPLDILFEVTTKRVLGSHAYRCWNLLDLLESYSQRPHQPVQNKQNVAGFSHDEKCHLCLEGGKGVFRGPRVPLEHERATLGRPSV